MPDLAGYTRRPVPGQTAVMAKQPKRNPSKPKPGTRPKRARRTVQQPLPGMIDKHGRTSADLAAAAAAAGLDHPLRTDALEELANALAAVGIDPRLPVQPDEFAGDRWHLLGHARTGHSEQVALAVEHAQDARALAATRVRTDAAGAALMDQLRAKVWATMCLRRRLRLPVDLPDARRPLTMDDEIITLVGPDDDERTALVTLKLPQVVIDRLRDAVHALAPRRTMAGISALGISMVLDVLEAEHLKHTGRRFPRRGGEVLEGGRPSRTRATTAGTGPVSQKPRKQAPNAR
jgi:hypothetical protein